MKKAKRKVRPPPNNLASVMRGLYNRVATRLSFDPSYVSRVARGERHSEQIEAALKGDMRQIMKMLRPNPHGSARHVAKHDGVKRKRVQRTLTS
jgi:hypothetical protein